MSKRLQFYILLVLMGVSCSSLANSTALDVNDVSFLLPQSVVELNLCRHVNCYPLENFNKFLITWIPPKEAACHQTTSQKGSFVS